MKTETKKKITLGVIAFLAMVAVMAVNVSANKLFCLNDGEQLPPGCSGSECRYTCDLRSGSGYCQVCTTDSGTPGVNPNSCHGQSCSFLNDHEDGNESPTDLTPPELIVNSPLEGEVYDSRRVPFDIEVDSRARIEYKLPEQNSWRKLCDNCRTYDRTVSLDEGLNEVMIRAKKLSNNMYSEVTRTFNVDSREPDFIDSMPDNGEFANGKFIVEYSEENLEKIELFYKGRDDLEWNNKDLTVCDSGTRVSCMSEINLDAYENTELMYYFNVCDSINCDMGDEKIVRVDSTPPVLTLNTPIESLYNERRILFDVSSDEEVNMYYLDNNDEGTRARRLCSNCMENDGSVSFRDGQHDITIYAEDEAGNKAEIKAEFIVDSRDPRLRRTEPGRGEFVGSPFFVQFDEDNPSSLILHYGNEETGMRDAEVNIEESCLLQRRGYDCITQDIPLIDYNGEEITYWFVLTDIVGNLDISRETTVNVDTVFPVINEITQTENRGRTEFVIDVSEENLDMITYEITSDSRPRERRLCSRLREGKCDRTLRFRGDGPHSVTIRVYDEAGHVVGEEIVV